MDTILQTGVKINPTSKHNPIAFQSNISSKFELRSSHLNLPTISRTMASSTLIHPCSSHTASPLSTISGTSLSFASISYSKNSIFRSLTLVPQLGLASFSTWNGLRRNGFSISLKSLRFEKKRKYGGKGVFASLFGVGAPEALVIGVVALLVFGPKGLAEIAKNLGKTLRAFQPTIRELQEVSREFKSTLEKEIGLDELKSPAPLNTSLSSSPLSVAPPENSQATATELTIDATTTGSQETATPLAATTEDSQATQESPPAATTKDSQETARLVAASTQDSQAVATTPAATTEDSQPTVSSVQEVAVGSEVGTAV